MRILNELNIEIENPDLNLGKLVEEKFLVAHHEAIEAVEEQSHYEVIATYPNGGKDVQKVIDVEAIEAKEAWDEYEDILRYIPYTETELILREYEKKRQPLTVNEIVEMLLPKLINTLEVDNNTAIRMKQFYSEWTENVSYEVGFKLKYNDKLYKVLQAHTSQAGWTPDAVPAMFTEINEEYAGTKEEPIPYNNNMALENGKYYLQDEVIYLCNRDTINPVYNDLKDLVGLYVEVL